MNTQDVQNIVGSATVAKLLYYNWQ